MFKIIYVCIKAATIGNGLGRHSFEPQKTYTERALTAAQLSKAQISNYFKKLEINVDNETRKR